MLLSGGGSTLEIMFFFQVTATPKHLIWSYLGDKPPCVKKPRMIRVQGLGFRVQGSGFRVQGLGFRAKGSGFRV